MTFDNQGKPARKLPYPLYYPQFSEETDATGVVTHTTPDMFPIDSDERIDVSFNLSLNEFVAIASALDIGRDIGYGEKSYEVWWVWVRSFLGAMGMSCAQVADCIESDADVLSALLAQLTANGYSPNSNEATANEIAPIAADKQTSDMLPTGYACDNPAQDMAVARAIVRELHESFVDFLEIIELSTNAVEAANITTDGVPIFGTLNNLTELADWYVETIAETYQAAYTQAVEDEISCVIFCALQSVCSLSLNELMNAYATLAPANPPTDDLQAFVGWLLEQVYSADTLTVATMHFAVLTIFRFGGQAFGGSFNSLQNIIRAATEWRDYSYEDCDDCPPTVTPLNFWRLYYDFALSDGGWVAFGAGVRYSPGLGWENEPNVASNVGCRLDLDDIGLNSLGGNWAIKGAYSEIYAVDAEGSGANDFYSMEQYSGANQVTLVTNHGNVTLGASAWKPAEYLGNRATGATTTAGRSFRVRRQVAGGAANMQAHWARITRIVIIGEPDGNGNKPDGSSWWRNVLPDPAPSVLYFED